MERSSANKRPRTGEPSTMRAAVYHSFGGPITVENVSRPKAPNGGVVLEVKATGVCRSDWHGWKGHDSDIVDHGLPFVPGHELSGIVSEVGTGVTNFAVGDRVAVPFILSCGHCRECARSRPTICESQQQPGFTIFGSFAEYVALPRADLNIAPLENDVWDSKKMQKVVSHTPIEREKFAKLYESVGWVDAVRKFVPEDKKLYSWWSYRAADWDAADKGRRLDHVWVTKPLSSMLQKQQVLRDVRGWQQPSDHVPVVVDLKKAA